MNETDYHQALVAVAERGSHRGADEVFLASERDASWGELPADVERREARRSSGARKVLLAAVVVLLIAVGLGLVARTRDASQDVVTVPDPRAGIPVSNLTDLLERMPAGENLAGSSVELTDVRGARRAWDLQPPQASEPGTRVSDDVMQLTQTKAGISLPAFGPCDDCGTGTVADVRESLVRTNGFSVSDLDAWVATDKLFMVIGRFDALASERALTPSGRDVQRSVYRDTVVLDVPCAPSAASPSPQQFGLTCAREGTTHLVEVINGSVIAQVPSMDLAKAILDRQAGVGPSAADDPLVRAMVAGADAQHAYQLRFIPPASSLCKGASTCGSSLYAPETKGALGLARQDGHAAASALYVVSNGSPDAAEANAATVKNWYATGKSQINAAPFSLKHDAAIVHVDGAVAVVVIPMKPGVPATDLHADFAKRDYPPW